MYIAVIVPWSCVSSAYYSSCIVQVGVSIVKLVQVVFVTFVCFPCVMCGFGLCGSCTVVSCPQHQHIHQVSVHIVKMFCSKTTSLLACVHYLGRF